MAAPFRNVTGGRCQVLDNYVFNGYAPSVLNLSICCLTATFVNLTL